MNAPDAERGHILIPCPSTDLIKLSFWLFGNVID